MLLVLQIVVSVVLLMQTTHSLVIKQEPHLDTELYVAPATYTRKDGKSLPSTIIISRPIGIKGGKDTIKEDFSQGTFTVIPSSDEDMSQGNIGVNPNIKFYRIECTSGQSCSSIIPMKTNPPNPPNPPEIPFTELELKKYLAQFGLYDGFPYSDDYENSGSPERPIETDDNYDTDRAFGSVNYNSNDFWPGSQYRPQSQPSKGQVHKFQHYDSGASSRPISDFPTRRPTADFFTRRPVSHFPTRRPYSDFPTQRPSPGLHTRRPVSDFPTRRPSIGWSVDTEDGKWEKVQTLSTVQNDRFQNPIRPHHSSRPQELPKPFSYDDDTIYPPDGPPRPSSPPRTTAHPTSYDGMWNRYGLSTVSQLDKETGEWVKISSSSTQLEHGLFDLPKTVPSANLPPATHHTKASLTVLGIRDRQPHSTFPDSNAHKSHVIKIPSSHPGNPPETIEIDGGTRGGGRGTTD